MTTIHKIIAAACFAAIGFGVGVRGDRKGAALQAWRRDLYHRRAEDLMMRRGTSR